jgi:starch phosphorylase
VDTSTLGESLLRLARNHAWTWSPATASVFEALPRSSAALHPVQIVKELGETDLRGLLGDDDLMDRIRETSQALDELRARMPDRPDVAYFSPEFGITDAVPQYSGGLGVLAGDHLKAASDLGLPLAGVGLFYRGGFFRQLISDHRQAERYETYEPENLGCVETGVSVEIPFPGRTVTAHVWRMDVGAVPLLLLDTDLAANVAEDRAIGDRLYSGGRRHRLEQEMVLGVGGARAVAAMGWDVSVHHLNEGHAGFLIIELLDHRIAAGATLPEALAAIRPGLVFTTHTPVPAGIDRFEPRLARQYLEVWADRWGVDVKDILELGADPGDDRAAFNMAALCLEASARANGVSRVHGAVSRRLFAKLPGGSKISSVTNGVHARTWVAPDLQDLFDDALGTGWTEGDAASWARVDTIDDAGIREVRRAGGETLRMLVEARTGATLDPEALIVGFARRFATYKRAGLLLRRPEALARLLEDQERPVQFVFAGKAHPADDAGKAVLSDILNFASGPVAQRRFLFVPDYDMAVAKVMCAGCDVWLNTPVRPREASGTSGEKSALNGGLNCSISDGWWAEMADGRNGWTIPASDAVDADRRDLDEAEAALTLLALQVVPEYYAYGGGWSGAWTARIRDSWRSLGPRVTAARMVRDYRDLLYGPAMGDVEAP